MNSSSTISDQPYAPTLDAAYLREEARRRIEKLASEIWTDYNSHDPGITILEVLAYAITDLGLRTRLEIPDLIEGVEEKPFLTAREVLPTQPYTSNDLRKILIDLPWIRNGWINPQPSSIQGLYSVLVDLEPLSISNELDLDLNINWISDELRLSSANVTFYVVFPNWDSLDLVWMAGQNLNAIVVNEIEKTEDPEKEVYAQYFLKADLTFGSGNNTITVTDQGFWVRLPIGVDKNDLNLDQEFRDMLEAYAEASDGLRLFQTHQIRARERVTRLAELKKYLMDYRNLCEDWESVSTTRVQQIGIQIATLELKADANPEEVSARILTLIDQFIDPNIPRSTFKDLLESGSSAEEIFNGPLLETGFITDEALNPLERENKIYTSDIIRIIMQQPEVIGVEGLTLDHFIERIHTASGVINCLQLRNPQLYKPRLSIKDSYIKVVKSGIQVPNDWIEVTGRWHELLQIYNQNINSGEGDLPVPSGDPELDLERFHSIQHDFPRTYGLLEGGVTKGATPLRKAQAKQLKAYLLFFEQLLANYCSQLAQLQTLFSVQENVDGTYFNQPLYDVPVVKNIYLEFAQGSETWEQFKQRDNHYRITLDNASEDQMTFLNRRNQFVDHLLARFGEAFTDYSQWKFYRNGGTIPPDLIGTKLFFLNNFPTLSSQRTKAFNYTATLIDDTNNSIPDIWDTGNVSGFEKRVAALLGIINFNRRSLASVDLAEEGMHLIEHVLLRPIEGTTNQLEPMQFTEAGNTSFIEDTYSYQVTVFLPTWAGNFEDAEYRSVAENTLREELPAYIFPWLYWVNLDENEAVPQEFIDFEESYQAWLENYINPSRAASQDELVLRIQQLINSDNVIPAFQYQAFSLNET